MSPSAPCPCSRASFRPAAKEMLGDRWDSVPASFVLAVNCSEVESISTGCCVGRPHKPSQGGEVKAVSAGGCNGLTKGGAQLPSSPAIGIKSGGGERVDDGGEEAGASHSALMWIGGVKLNSGGGGGSGEFTDCTGEAAAFRGGMKEGLDMCSPSLE